MKKQILMAVVLSMLPIFASAQLKSEDPAIAQQRAEMEAEMKARMEADRVFIKSLESKTPVERQAAIKARHETQRQAAAQKQAAMGTVAPQPEDPAMAKQRAEMEAAMKSRMEADRAFIKGLEGKTPAERQAAIKARHEIERQAAVQRQAAVGGQPAMAEDPAMAKQRAEMEAKMKARMEADRAFIKSLEGKTPAERQAAIKARHESERRSTSGI